MQQYHAATMPGWNLLNLMEFQVLINNNVTGSPKKKKKKKKTCQDTKIIALQRPSPQCDKTKRNKQNNSKKANIWNQ